MSFPITKKKPFWEARDRMMDSITNTARRMKFLLLVGGLTLVQIACGDGLEEQKSPEQIKAEQIAAKFNSELRNDDAPVPSETLEP